MKVEDLVLRINNALIVRGYVARECERKTEAIIRQVFAEAIEVKAEIKIGAGDD